MTPPSALPTPAWTRRQTTSRVLLCVASGTLLFLACADFDIWPLAWIGLVPLLFVVLDPRCRRPFLYGWITGCVANGGGFYWINGLLQRFGHMPLVASLPLYALLIGYQALAFAVFAWVLRRLRDHVDLPVTFLAPIVMTAVELIVPFVFPWYLAITQAWVPPVIQIAELTGPLGVSFLLVLASGALYDALHAGLRRAPLPARRLLGAAAIVAFALAYGQVRIRQVTARRAAAPKVKVGLVQANIGINEKWMPGLREHNLEVHQRLSVELERQGAELLVWPESSYPYAIGRGQAGDFPETDRRRVRRGFHAPLLFGAVTVSDDSPFPYNSALMMDEAGAFRGRFDKNFLLVFGEYIPYYEQLAWARRYIPEMSNFARGEGVTTFPFRGSRIGPMICYEDIIPSFGRRLVAERPNLLVNITNDAWFGATSEPWEHMALSVYRAVEHRLDLVRAVNTGVSAFIDATGRVYRTSKAVDPDVTPGVRPAPLLDEVALLDASGAYEQVGDLFGILCLVAVLGLGVLARVRAGHPLAWTEVAVGAAVVAALTAAAALAAAGPARLGAAALQVLHRPSPDELSFAATLVLTAGGGVACFSAGLVLALRTRARPRLEAAVAALAVLLAPALLVGRTEGATSSLVFTALFAVAAALLGVRLGARVRGVSRAAPRSPPPRRPVTPSPRRGPR